MHNVPAKARLPAPCPRMRFPTLILLTLVSCTPLTCTPLTCSADNVPPSVIIPEEHINDVEEILRGFTMEQKAAKMVGRVVGRGLGCGLGCGLARAVCVSLCAMPERLGGGPCHRPGRDTRRALHPAIHRGKP